MYGDNIDTCCIPGAGTLGARLKEHSMPIINAIVHSLHTTCSLIKSDLPRICGVMNEPHVPSTAAGTCGT